MKFYLCAFIACLIFTAVVAQQQKAKTNRWHYSGLVQGGLLVGSSTVTYQVQTAQGIEKNNWFAGVGFGYDDYGIPGLPLVLHGQKAFTQKRSKPFVYAQTGLQFPIKKGDWKSTGWMGTSNYDLKKGYLAELGGGYKIGLGKRQRTALLFSGGYSYKFNKATYTELAWPPYLSSLPPAGYNKYYTEYQSYHYRRIVLKAGFMF